MGRVVLCLVDDFLGVVQQEGAKLGRRTLGSVCAKLLKWNVVKQVQGAEPPAGYLHFSRFTLQT